MFNMQVHFVYYAVKYHNLETAMHKHDGLFVLAIIAKISNSTNHAFDEIMKAIPKITKYHSKTTLSHIIFEKFLPKDKKIYFKYKGSLTTPPCSQSITFVILAQPI